MEPSTEARIDLGASRPSIGFSLCNSCATQKTNVLHLYTRLTYAEFIWARASEGKTQHDIAEMMQGWSREKVKNYASLKQIDPLAWEVIGTTFEDIVPMTDEGAVPTNGTTVPVFTEGLLRSILDLTPTQQLDLVQSLAKGDIQKGKFKTLAEAYKGRNEMQAYALQQLGNVSIHRQIKRPWRISHTRGASHRD